MPFTLKTINAFEMTHRMAACEVTSKLSGYRAFVAVYPPDPERDREAWIVRRFEVPAELIEEYFPQEALANAEYLEVNSMQEAEDLLTSWGVDASLLDAPWNCDYPL